MIRGFSIGHGFDVYSMGHQCTHFIHVETNHDKPISEHELARSTSWASAMSVLWQMFRMFGQPWPRLAVNVNERMTRQNRHEQMLYAEPQTDQLLHTCSRLQHPDSSGSWNDMFSHHCQICRLNCSSLTQKWMACQGQDVSTLVPTLKAGFVQRCRKQFLEIPDWTYVLQLFSQAKRAVFIFASPVDPGQVSRWAE